MSKENFQQNKRHSKEALKRTIGNKEKLHVEENKKQKLFLGF